MIIKNIFSVILSVTSVLLYSQVGIGTTLPTAALDITSNGNTAATKALEINNSTGTEILTLLNDSKLGIGTSSPNATLEVIGSVNFPIVANTSVPGPYGSLAVNQTTGALGIRPSSSQPAYEIVTNIATTGMNNTTTASRDLNFSTSPNINTLGITKGQDTGINLSDGTNNTAVTYFQVSQAGIYRFDISGSFRCSSAANNASSLNINLNLWKAPGNTSYTIYDDYRIVNLFGDGNTFATPFSQSFVLLLTAGEKIAFRIYKALSTGTISGCSIQLPTSGDQQNSMKLGIVKL